MPTQGALPRSLLDKAPSPELGSRTGRPGLGAIARVVVSGIAGRMACVGSGV